ncbi:FAD-dependent monooxygenase [Gemmatimonas sp.]|uniref:FAD-dependent monooxygenase n=1 Tax=Gemmatimonas sp. TaxID=1962908 RepID=UPI003F71E9CB
MLSVCSVIHLPGLYPVITQQNAAGVPWRGDGVGDALCAIAGHIGHVGHVVGRRVARSDTPSHDLLSAYWRAAPPARRHDAAGGGWLFPNREATGLSILPTVCYAGAVTHVAARILSPEAREEKRRTAVRLREQGQTFVAIAALLGVSRAIVATWMSTSEVLPSSARVVRRLMRTVYWPKQLLANVTSASAWESPDRRPDNRWYRGRCLLVGDAAHPTTPNLGQGGGLASEDAACLRHLFTQALPLDQLLPTFVTLRHDRAATINRDSNRVGRTGQWSGHVACWIRDGVARQVMPLFGVNELIKHAGHVGPFMVD